MQNPDEPSVWRRSTTRRLFSWLFSWRGIRRILIVLVWIVTLIALLYAEENWRGGRAWNKYRKELEARGEQLDLQAFIPKPIPDSSNFAATPFFEFLFAQKTNRYDWDDGFSRADRRIVRPTAKGEPAQRRFTDLVAWQAAFATNRVGRPADEVKVEPGPLDRASRAQAAPAVLEALQSNEVHFAELRAASQRPLARYPVNYDLENPWGILLPHLASMKAVVQRLQLRTCAELAAGQTEQALADARLMLRLTDSLKDEPFLISYLVRLACLHIATQPIWEGLADRRWNDAQLQELQAHFHARSLIGDLERSLHAERAAGVLTADLLYRQKYRLSQLKDSEGADSAGICLPDLLAWLAPRGWYNLEQLNYSLLYASQLAGAFDPAHRRIFPDQLGKHPLRSESPLSSFLQHRSLAALLLPALDKVPVKAAGAQAAADLVALACALERHRLAQNQFPETLDALTPRFLPQVPRDPITGAPYRYRRTDDGSFVLYSVGVDMKDGGGVSGPRLFDEKEGDWVWQYSTPSQSSPGSNVSPR